MPFYCSRENKVLENGAISQRTHFLTNTNTPTRVYNIVPALSFSKEFLFQWILMCRRRWKEGMLPDRLSVSVLIVDHYLWCLSFIYVISEKSTLGTMIFYRTIKISNTEGKCSGWKIAPCHFSGNEAVMGQFLTTCESCIKSRNLNWMVCRRILLTFSVQWHADIDI